MLEHERELWRQGRRHVAGVDEAGRGPLAGPVVAACVVFDPAVAECELNSSFVGLTDSKALSPARRERFHELLTRHAGVRWAIGLATREEIDASDILRATWLAMRRAIKALAEPPDHVLVDGLPVPDLPAPSTAIVGGDRRSLSIAAASVIAKVTRDRLMMELDRRWPQYGFGRHKGYGTPAHLSALQRWGPCPEHRLSFAPVAACAGAGPGAHRR